MLVVFIFDERITRIKCSASFCSEYLTVSPTKEFSLLLIVLRATTIIWRNVKSIEKNCKDAHTEFH